MFYRALHAGHLVDDFLRSARRYYHCIIMIVIIVIIIIVTIIHMTTSIAVATITSIRLRIILGIARRSRGQDGLVLALAYYIILYYSISYNRIV